MTADNAVRPGASDLLRGLGLLVDGPVGWERPVPGRGPGVFIVELPGGLADAPVDIVAVRRWLERVPTLTLDGERPSAEQIAKRLHEFWLAFEPVLYVGRSAKQVAGRLAAIYATPLGDARPHSGGHWLKTLSVLSDLRVWWADTDAHEEYEDALLAEIAKRNADPTSAATSDAILPFANLMTSRRQAETAWARQQPANRCRRRCDGDEKCRETGGQARADTHDANDHRAQARSDQGWCAAASGAAHVRFPRGPRQVDGGAREPAHRPAAQRSSPV